MDLSGVDSLEPPWQLILPELMEASVFLRLKIAKLCLLYGLDPGDVVWLRSKQIRVIAQEAPNTGE